MIQFNLWPTLNTFGSLYCRNWKNFRWVSSSMLSPYNTHTHTCSHTHTHTRHTLQSKLQQLKAPFQATPLCKKKMSLSVSQFHALLEDGWHRREVSVLKPLPVTSMQKTALYQNPETKLCDSCSSNELIISNFYSAKVSNYTSSLNELLSYHKKLCHAWVWSRSKVTLHLCS